MMNDMTGNVNSSNFDFSNFKTFDMGVMSLLTVAKEIKGALAIVSYGVVLMIDWEVQKNNLFFNVVGMQASADIILTFSC